jgi:hypothetical protein
MSLLDIDNLDSLCSDQSILKFKCLNWIKIHSCFGEGWQFDTHTDNLTINTDKLFKNKSKQFSEIMNDPSEYILYNCVKFSGGACICHLRIYKANEPVPASFYACYKSRNGEPSYSYYDVVTIDRIINEN